MRKYAGYCREAQIAYELACERDEERRLAAMEMDEDDDCPQCGAPLNFSYAACRGHCTACDGRGQ